MKVALRPGYYYPNKPMPHFFGNEGFMVHFSFLTANQLLAENGLNMKDHAAGKGIGLVLMRWLGASDSGASRRSPVVQTGLQGKGLCGKEALLLS